MHDGIGSTLREARNRRKIDLSEVEAATKIRLRYLRAMESEEWDVLPGGPYTRGFIRTYGRYLGLDGDRLADDYVRSAGGEGARPPRQEPAALPSRPARQRPLPLPSGRTAAVAVSLVLVAVLVAVGLAGRKNASVVREGASRATGKSERHAVVGRTEARPRVAVELAATAEVWVCLLDATGKPLIDGQILEAGAEEGPFRSGRFTVSFGNGEVELRVDGRRAEIPASAGPVGYRIDAAGDLRPLEAGERPECT